MGLIWSLLELGYPGLQLNGMRRLAARLLSIALGLTTYGAVAGVAWVLEPVPKVDHETGFPAFMSVS